ncbi:UDP-glucose 4-epimerase GalE [Acinetobacter qingfengensis]|uniref:UDP-glucose 4-epimerase n=1 Tax=Acinetobacter qingfengensis TaxID=1262585 RepID=A0A1E7RDC0_9GAMM|nr:UDP-glucose 4-epimerase GalE [Acinetobacter qingfengensis]KAA8732051.1 UDP-glucose 4-epimerase GalE [Acinetobacter qingfengensis]OEY97276.1 UDP-glucose 4-epimerase GalE [Acinetobacter qingfengensis]
MKQSILVTGGAGFIGSHCCVELLDHNFNVIVLDNLSNSSIKVLDRIKKITGKELHFIQGDIRDKVLLDQVFTQHHIDAVIHFAGLKAVGESMQVPLTYFDNNISGSITLLQAMQQHRIGHLVFSSSATVYGENYPSPLHEDLPTAQPTNNYGYSKLAVEQILQATAKANDLWSFALLRYFNPIGAHQSGLIGEDPNGIPNNLLPYVTQTAMGKREVLSIYGHDYPTQDGTGVRDFIHVVDLAHAHVKALQYLFTHKPSVGIWNIGTGTGYSVLEVVKRFEQVNQLKLNYQFVERRAGDVAVCFADANKAKQDLGFVAEHNLDDMLRDVWHWQSQNPDGYA